MLIFSFIVSFFFFNTQNNCICNYFYLLKNKGNLIMLEMKIRSNIFSPKFLYNFRNISRKTTYINIIQRAFMRFTHKNIFIEGPEPIYLGLFCRPTTANTTSDINTTAPARERTVETATCLQNLPNISHTLFHITCELPW